MVKPSLKENGLVRGFERVGEIYMNDLGYMS